MQSILLVFGGVFIGMALGGVIATLAGPLRHLSVDVGVAVAIGGFLIALSFYGAFRD